MHVLGLANQGPHCPGVKVQEGTPYTTIHVGPLSHDGRQDAG